MKETTNGIGSLATTTAILRFQPQENAATEGSSCPSKVLALERRALPDVGFPELVCDGRRAECALDPTMDFGSFSHANSRGRFFGRCRAMREVRSAQPHPDVRNPTNRSWSVGKI